MEVTLTKSSYNSHLRVFIISTCITVLFLFFIDEGNYSFQGFKEPVHWLVFLIYTVPTILAQLLIYKLLTRINLESGKLLFSTIFGLLIGVTGVISLFYLIK